jgi:uncharacterized protein YkwD
MFTRKATAAMMVFMRPLYIVAALLAAAAALVALWPRSDKPVAAGPCGTTDQPPSKTGLDSAGRATVCLVNRERTQHGLPPLRQNRLLDTASAEHSQDMVRRDYFEHATPDGRSVGDRLRAIGYQRGVSASAGENIAYGVGKKSTPVAIVRAWMNSPGHRADILRPSFNEIGIGIALGAPEVLDRNPQHSATYTTDFGGVIDPSLPNG